MKDLAALYKQIRQIDEQTMSDIEKYRLGQISKADLRKSEEFRRMSNQQRWEQGLLDDDEYRKGMTSMEKYRAGLISQDELARSQAVEPVYPESLLGLGGAIRGGINLAQKGISGVRNLFGRQTAKPPEVPINPPVVTPSGVQPTIPPNINVPAVIRNRPGQPLPGSAPVAAKPPASTPSTPPAAGTPSAPPATPPTAAKPRIERRPGESTADAVKRAQDELKAAEAPRVWRNPRTGEVTSTPPGRAPAAAKPTEPAAPSPAAAKPTEPAAPSPAGEAPRVWRNPRTGEVTSTPPGSTTVPPKPPARPSQSKPGEFKDTSGPERAAGSPAARPTSQDNKGLKRATAASLAGHGGLLWLLNRKKENEPKPPESNQGGSSPNITWVDLAPPAAPAAAQPAKPPEVPAAQPAKPAEIPAAPAPAAGTGAAGPRTDTGTADAGTGVSSQRSPAELTKPPVITVAPAAQPAAPAAGTGAAAQPAQPAKPAAPAAGTGTSQPGTTPERPGAGAGAGAGTTGEKPLDYFDLMIQKGVPGYRNEDRSTKKLMREFNRHLSRIQR